MLFFFGTAAAELNEQANNPDSNGAVHEERDWSKGWLSGGLSVGGARTEVTPNPDDIFNEEFGLSLGFRFAYEKPLLRFLTIHGGFNYL